MSDDFKQRQIDNLIKSNSLASLQELARRRKCGNCYNWMKSSMCPKEHNVRGRSRGPSSSVHACNEFVPDQDIKFAEEAIVIKKLMT